MKRHRQVQFILAVLLLTSAVAAVAPPCRTMFAQDGEGETHIFLPLTPVGEILAVCPADPTSEAEPYVYWRGCEWLQGADLFGANLLGANLSYTNLTDANLFAANLADANLSYATLTDANLFAADLTGANLFGANLNDANLFGADLTAANLFGADLTATNLFAVIWGNTICPDGSNTDTNGLGACGP